MTPLRSALVGLCLLALLGGLPGAVRAEEPAGGKTRIQTMVDELMPIVAKMRGLAWKQPVPAKVLTREELGAFLEKQLARDVTPEEWQRDTRILRRLGMLRPDEDLRTLVKVMFQAGIEGLYDPETKKMYVVAGNAGDGMRPTILHELIHALDDQHLGLEELEEPYRDHEPDRVFALRCLFEGGAEYARRRYLDDDMDVARIYYRQQAHREKDASTQRQMMKRVPTHMLLATMLHYRTGPNFVTQALGNDFAGGMARLFADPPTTQEQCLYPYKWLGPRRDYPRKVVWGGDYAQAMGAGWTRLDEHSVGEIDLAVYVDYFFGDDGGRLNPQTLGKGQFVSVLASRAARGWDAGRTYYLQGPAGHIVVLHAFAFDTVDDAREGARFLAATLHRESGRTWKGAGWTPYDEADPAKGRAFDYVGKHGRGRVAQRGREVRILDGIRPELFDALWAVHAKTRFEQDPRDEGDDPVDPFAGCAVVDRDRGLALKLPGGHWRGTEAVSASPLAFATARSGTVSVDFTVIDQEVTQAGLPGIARMVLGKRFRESGAKPADLMGVRGLVHPLPARPGTKRRLYVASDAARTYVVVVSGAKADLVRLEGDIELLLRGVRIPPRTPRPGAPVRAAGLRSIPGY